MLIILLYQNVFSFNPVALEVAANNEACVAQFKAESAEGLLWTSSRLQLGGSAVLILNSAKMVEQMISSAFDAASIAWGKEQVRVGWNMDGGDDQGAEGASKEWQESCVLLLPLASQGYVNLWRKSTPLSQCFADFLASDISW